LKYDHELYGAYPFQGIKDNCIELNPPDSTIDLTQNAGTVSWE